MPTVTLASPRAKRIYTLAQIAGLGLTGVLLAGLVLRPALTLHVLWDMIIPILPATFLVSPMLWRNVCPLATLNSVVGARTTRERLRAPTLRTSWGLGIVLLALLVPARRFAFNTNGALLAGVIVVVAILALAAGTLAPRRNGFCNAICPVLPVEKLYGQDRLATVGSARCTSCSVCTTVGCIDLADRKTVAQTLGVARRDELWLVTPFGAFAAAFPGFVIGYFRTTNGGFDTAVGVYLTVLAWAAASYVALGGLAWMWRLRAELAVRACGALAFGLYYWFAAPGLAAAYGGAPSSTGDGTSIRAWGVRAAALLLLALWQLRTQRVSPMPQLVRIER